MDLPVGLYDHRISCAVRTLLSAKKVELRLLNANVRRAGVNHQHSRFAIDLRVEQKFVLTRTPERNGGVAGQRRAARCYGSDGRARREQHHQADANSSDSNLRFFKEEF